MRRPLILMAVLVFLFPLAGYAQDGRAALEAVAKAMGAASVKSIQYFGNGVNFQVGQNYTADLPWPRFVAPRPDGAAGRTAQRDRPLTQS